MFTSATSPPRLTPTTSSAASPPTGDQSPYPAARQILFEGDDQTTLGGHKIDGHQGGALHFGLDGKLYVGIGEQTAEKPSQSLQSLLGKILRLNPDGTIPDDNPFVGQTTGKYRAIWALGCRNPFAFAVQPETGRLFINDVGGKAEEINEGRPGANYGWPTADHGPTTDSRFTGPLHHYPTACITGGAFCRRGLPLARPSTTARYFFADFNHGFLKHLDPDHPEQANPLRHRPAPPGRYPLRPRRRASTSCSRRLGHRQPVPRRHRHAPENRARILIFVL